MGYLGANLIRAEQRFIALYAIVNRVGKIFCKAADGKRRPACESLQRVKESRFLNKLNQENTLQYRAAGPHKKET
jgi:hypothetical protein